MTEAAGIFSFLASTTDATTSPARGGIRLMTYLATVKEKRP